MADGLECRVLGFGEFTLDPADERLCGPSGPVKIGNKAFRVLLALATQHGVLVTKEALFDSVWEGTIVSESALTSVIKELRRALGDESRKPRYIESAYGRGYRFIAPVHAAESASPPPRDAARTAASPSNSAQAEPPTVIVSEFTDSAIRETHPYCAEQLREEVLSGLARFREIQLIAEDPDRPPVPPDEFARGYRVSATLLPEGAAVKVSARVSRLADGVVIWAESLSLGDGGTATSVERIVSRIVGTALPAVDADVALRLPPVSGAFYDRYLIAKRKSVAPESFETAKSAAKELEQLVVEQPGFGLSYPPLARLYNTDFAFTALASSGTQERARALQLAKAGLLQDRGNVHAHTVLAFSYLYNGQHAQARQSFEQALVLNPYNPARLNEVAAGMIYLMELERASELFEKGLELQRFPDDNLLEDKGKLALVTGDAERARDALLSMAMPTIWSEMYLALAELELAGDAGRERFASWLARVESDWHTTQKPAASEISKWVRGHHPFVPGGGENLFNALERALSEAPAPSRAAVRAAE